MTKKITAIGLLTALITTCLIASGLPFIEEHFYPKTIIVAFTADAIGNTSGKIDFTKENDIVKTHIGEFNKLAEEFQIVDLTQMFDFVKDPEWSDNGVYLQNIYKLTLKSNDNIEKAQEKLAKQKYVVYAEYEAINRFRYTPNDPEFSQQWHHKVIQTPDVWDYTKGSKEIVVAITDSGVKWNHPDLADNIWINEAELPGITINWASGSIIGGDGRDNDGNGRIDDIMGWDFVDNDNNPYQYHPGSAHGTHVAGCAGAVGDNGVGVAGAALTVSIMICKGSPTGEEAKGVQYGYQQIKYAADTGADIINCSWGGPGSGGTATTTVNNATQNGSLVVVAAGNDNTEHNSSYRDYPADVPSALCVAASGPGDIKAGFSDYGEPIDLMAPGANIRAPWIQNNYSTQSGTSMASPVVAGVAALVKTLHPHLGPTDIKDRLMFTCDYVDDLNPNYAGLLGFGRLNAFKAVMFDLIPNLSIFDYSVEEANGDMDGVPNPGEEVNLFVHIFNELDWLTAADVTATLSTNASGVEIIQDTIGYPVIDGGSVSFNTRNPFIFKTDEFISNLTIPFKVTITANHNAQFPYEKSFDLEVDLSLQQAGWPLALGGVSTSSALITDINRDESAEIIFGDPSGNLRVVQKDKTPLPGFPVNLGSAINTAVAAADLTVNGRKEIVAHTASGKIFCVDYRGRILFEHDAGGRLSSNPMIIDVDGDHKFEIVSLTFSNPQLIVLNADGTMYPGFPIDISGPVMSAPASADLNGDGNKEIIFSTSAGQLHAISIVTKQDLPGWPKSIGAASWNGPIVADISGNGSPDVLVANIQGIVKAFDNEGNEFISRALGNQVRAGVLAYDLDNDGTCEIIVADMSGNIIVLDNNGNPKPNFPKNTGSPIESTPVLADMDLNGKLDIVYGDSGGLLHSIGLDGKETSNFPISLQSSISTSAAIGFVENDDTPGILIPNLNGYNFIDFKRPIGEIAWGFFRGNDRRSGNYADLTPVKNMFVEAPLPTKLIGNYPNPFNPETEINFSLSTQSDVTIYVYNTRGQLVKTLLDTSLPIGNHKVVWDGKDYNGKGVSSGMYFYTLQAGAYKSTKKMMLLK